MHIIINTTDVRGYDFGSLAPTITVEVPDALPIEDEYDMTCVMDFTPGVVTLNAYQMSDDEVDLDFFEILVDGENHMTFNEDDEDKAILFAAWFAMIALQTKTGCA